MTNANQEVEIKIPLQIAPQAAIELLASHGFHISADRVFESNQVFDTEGQTVRAAGQLLRLRRVGSRAILTFKGPAVAAKHKTREELELEVSNADMLERILSRLSYQVSFRYDKYRTEFSRDSEPGGITLDETPIGLFLELEGEPHWIDETASELGFSEQDYVNASYGSLFLEYKKKHNLSKEYMTFD